MTIKRDESRKIKGREAERKGRRKEDKKEGMKRTRQGGRKEERGKHSGR